MKWLLSLVFVAAIGGAIWFFLNQSSSNQRVTGGLGVDGSLIQPEGPVQSEPTALQGSGSTGTNGSSSSSGGGARAVVDPGLNVPQPVARNREDGTLEVIALDPQNKQGIEGAMVFLLDRDLVPSREWQAAFQSPNKDDYIRSKSVAVMTDEEGVALVPGCNNGVVLIVAEDLRGEKDWIGPVGSPLKVTLRASVDLIVRTVDAEDRPVVGCPVAIIRRKEETPQALMMRQTVAPSGEARFTFLRRLLRQRQDPGGYAVGLGFPNLSGVPVPIDAENLPKAPVKLIVPPTAKVSVKVLDETGAPIEGPFTISLGTMVTLEGRPKPVFRSVNSQRASNSSAKFQWIEVGLPLTIQLSGQSSMQDAIFEEPGPNQAGKEHEVVLHWDSRMPTLLARAVDSSGSPLGGLRGRMRLWTNGRASGAPPLSCDDEGNFEIVLREPWEQGTVRIAKMDLWSSSSEPPYAAEIDLSFDPRPGRTPYGDVLFKHKPLLAEGRVVDRQGSSLFSTSVRAAAPMIKTKQNQEGGRDWDHLPDLMATTDQEGVFRIYGETEHPVVRLVARRRGYNTATLDDVTPGATGLTIELEEATNTGQSEDAERRYGGKDG